MTVQTRRHVAGWQAKSEGENKSDGERFVGPRRVNCSARNDKVERNSPIETLCGVVYADALSVRLDLGWSLSQIFRLGLGRD